MKRKAKTIKIASLFVDLICYVFNIPFIILGKILDIADIATR